MRQPGGLFVWWHSASCLVTALLQLSASAVLQNPERFSYDLDRKARRSLWLLATAGIENSAGDRGGVTQGVNPGFRLRDP